jgi:cytochrome c peroxidase
VLHHPPYFHDGSADTLEAAVDFMLGGGNAQGNKYIDAKLKAAKVSAQERDQLLAFLRALSPERIEFQRPTLP